MFKKLRDKWKHRGEPVNHPFGNVQPSGCDLRGLPTPECLCGGRTFFMLAWFADDTRDVAGYILDGLCADCGALVTLPTPIDFDVMEVFGDG